MWFSFVQHSGRRFHCRLQDRAAATWPVYHRTGCPCGLLYMHCWRVEQSLLVSPVYEMMDDMGHVYLVSRGDGLLFKMDGKDDDDGDDDG